MLKNKDDNGNYGRAVNKIVGWIGMAGILLGFCVQQYCDDIGTIVISVGASIVATALVTWMNAKYILKTQRMEGLISVWRLHNIYESKSEMNERDANVALEQCGDSIDIIAEGLFSYISNKGDVLKDKIVKNGVRVRIISCDSDEMLRFRAKDEIGPECSGDDAVLKVKKLDQWVRDVREALGENGENDEKKDRLQIRYHSSYPGFSYLRIDKMSFVSANLWEKPSQQCFAISFEGSGKGDEYFKQYFESLWENSVFVHQGCKLLK